jgi:transposase
MEGDLRDDQWELIGPLLPLPKKRGRPRADDRKTINGILWVLRSGARWRDLPRRYGASSTCHRRLQEWQLQGVWEGIWLKFLSALDAQEKLDWNQAFLDGSFVPGKKQLSLMSRMLNIRSPGLLMFDHGVQDDQELAHASSQSHFPSLARPTKTVVKGLDDRVISSGG